MYRVALSLLEAKEASLGTNRSDDHADGLESSGSRKQAVEFIVGGEYRYCVMCRVCQRQIC